MRAICLVLVLLSAWSSSQGQSPNFLFIVSDDLNTRIGPYKNIENHTPNLDRLSAEGVKFTKAYSQYPVCRPSRASFMTGLYPETNGIINNSNRLVSYKVENPDLVDHPSIAGFLRENGYYTARVSKIFHMGVPGGIERGDAGADDPTSWDYSYNVMAPETMSQGELERLSPSHMHYGSSFARIILDNDKAETQADHLAVNQAIAILENRSGKLPEGGTNRRRLKPDAPFFLAVGLVRPHVPFVAPKRSFAPYPDEEMELPEYMIGENVPKEAQRNRNMNIWKMNEQQQKQTIAGYLASVRFMDEQVGRLLDALDRLGLKENTIVVFISDHGYTLGEHDSWAKSTLWEGSVRVPLIISHPEFPQEHGKSNESIVELLDLYPTIVDLANIESVPPSIIQGENLGQLVKEGGVLSDRVAYSITNRGNAASIRTERWRYTNWGEGDEKEELYDHQNDPQEHVNLAGDDQFESILSELREKMKRITASVQND